MSKSYKDIISFLEKKDSKLHEIITDLCISKSLSYKGLDGITFLYPGKKGEYREKLATAYEEDDEDTACNIINSLIITLPLENTEDFMRHRDDIPNRLNQIIEIERVTNREVILKSGAKLTKNEKFSSSKPYYVYDITNGEVPLDGPTSKHKYDKIKKKKKNSESATPMVESRRGYLVKKLYNDSISGGKNVYCKYMASLLAYIKENYPSIFSRVAPVIDMSPLITFFLLIEPFKTKGTDYMIEDNIINDWLDNRSNPKQPTVVYSDILEGLAERDDAAIFSDAVDVFEAIKSTGQGFIGGGMKKAKFCTKVRDFYTKVMKNNEIDDYENLFPKEFVQCMTLDKKLWQDELRFNIVRIGISKLSKIHSFVQDNMPGNNYSSEINVCDSDLFSKKIACIEEFFSGPVLFTRSTEFMYFAVPPSKIEELTEDFTEKVIFEGDDDTVNFLSQRKKDLMG